MNVLAYERREITVRRGKGNKDRRTLLPDFVIPGLKLAIDKVEQFHEIDQADGISHVCFGLRNQTL